VNKLVRRPVRDRAPPARGVPSMLEMACAERIGAERIGVETVLVRMRCLSVSFGVTVEGRKCTSTSSGWLAADGAGTTLGRANSQVESESGCVPCAPCVRDTYVAVGEFRIERLLRSPNSRGGAGSTLSVPSSSLCTSLATLPAPPLLAARRPLQQAHELPRTPAGCQHGREQQHAHRRAHRVRQQVQWHSTHKDEQGSARCAAATSKGRARRPLTG
jgi:hypothetical protein